MKTKKITIVLKLILVLALLGCLVFVVTAGVLANKEKHPSLDDGAKLYFSHYQKDALLNSDVTVGDLDDYYRGRLSEFTQTDLSDWQSPNIFRNYSNYGGFILAYDDNGNPYAQEDHGWQGIGMIDANDFIHKKNADEALKDYTIKYVKTKKLRKGEILVHKWVYYTLYACSYPFSLELDKVKEILDDEDTYAKHIILRNAGSKRLFCSPGMAFCHYGIVPDAPDRILTLTCRYNEDDPGVSRTFKIAGYYEGGEDDVLAGYVTDRYQVNGSRPESELGEFELDNKFSLILKAANFRTSLIYSM